jgi:hypothetical protein
MINLEPVVTRFWGSLLITGSASGFPAPSSGSRVPGSVSRLISPGEMPGACRPLRQAVRRSVVETLSVRLKLPQKCVLSPNDS